MRLGRRDSAVALSGRGESHLWTRIKRCAAMVTHRDDMHDSRLAHHGGWLADLRAHSFFRNWSKPACGSTPALDAGEGGGDFGRWTMLG